MSLYIYIYIRTKKALHEIPKKADHNKMGIVFGPFDYHSISICWWYTHIYLCIYIYIYTYTYVQIWFLVSCQQHWGIKFSTKIPRIHATSRFLNTAYLRETCFCKGWPHMAALADPPEAKCAYIDHLSLICPYTLDFLERNIILYVNIFISNPVSPDTTLFHVETSVVYFRKNI